MKDIYLLGIDVGTTSVKGIIVSANGDVKGVAGKEYTLETKGDIVELDPEVYWNSTIAVIKELILKSEIEINQIKGLAFSSQGETLICVDENGKPLRKAIVWLDNRSIKEAKQIEESFGKEKILNVTGQGEVLPLWPATRILWLRKNEPEIFTKTSKFLLVEDYLIYRLTGFFVSEQSLVSSTLYFDIIKKEWWRDMLDFLQISSKKLPLVKASGEKVASITEEAAKATGLSLGTFACTGAYDHPAGAIGAGNIKAGVVSETTGASMAMVVTLDGPLLKREINLPCQCHAIPGKYFLLPYGQTAGMVLKWFRNEFCKGEVETAKASHLDAYDLITEDAQKVSPGADGLIMLPHLSGTGSPEFNPEVRGVFAGVTLEMHKGHFVRAILESVACMIKRNLKVLEGNGLEVKEIRALGGGAKSLLWNQIKADLLGIPVFTLDAEETPSLGAAILAGVACGVFNDVEDGCQKMVVAREKFNPNKNLEMEYKIVFRKYEGLYASLENYWKIK